tara:strand:+ start:667 stop:837 length:171 start_codon:yes stop_codon:yes gene_type:complete
MNKLEQSTLADALQMYLDESQRMFVEGMSHAQIIGYLQGTVKTAILHLDGESNETI